MESPVLDTIIERIVEAVDLGRILLFGSAARDEVGPHSDFDLLVAKEEGEVSRGHLVEELYEPYRRGAGRGCTCRDPGGSRRVS